eukprot:scaffold267166_cov22-Tisochrysis_lutea.AAC.1
MPHTRPTAGLKAPHIPFVGACQHKAAQHCVPHHLLATSRVSAPPNSTLAQWAIISTLRSANAHAVYAVCVHAACSKADTAALSKS